MSVGGRAGSVCGTIVFVQAGGWFHANGMGRLQVISCDAEASHLCAQEAPLLACQTPTCRRFHGYQDNDIESAAQVAASGDTAVVPGFPYLAFPRENWKAMPEETAAFMNSSPGVVPSFLGALRMSGEGEEGCWGMFHSSRIWTSGSTGTSQGCEGGGIAGRWSPATFSFDLMSRDSP